MKRFVLLALLQATSAPAAAIVIRHDVDDAKYRVQANELPALFDMPGEGHGSLISPRWAVAAAHTLRQHSELKQVAINGLARLVERVAIHPGYKTLPRTLIDQATVGGEAMS